MNSTNTRKVAKVPSRWAKTVATSNTNGLVMQRLAERLEDRAYDGLELVTCIFEQETHLSVAPAAMSRGLRVVFG